MKTPRLFLGASGPVCMALCLAAVLPATGSAQANPLIGTWRLNVAKSTYSPGPPPKSNTVTFEAVGRGFKHTSAGIDAAGKPTSLTYTANFDGKEYAATGSPDIDAVAFKRIDASTIEVARKMGGKTVQTARYVFTNGGKTLTITAKGTNANSQTVNNVMVFERR